MLRRKHGALGGSARAPLVLLSVSRIPSAATATTLSAATTATAVIATTTITVMAPAADDDDNATATAAAAATAAATLLVLLRLLLPPAAPDAAAQGSFRNEFSFKQALYTRSTVPVTFVPSSFGYCSVRVYLRSTCR